MNSEERAYSEGHNAYYNGYRLKHNPYKRFSLEWNEWREGWHDEKNDNPYWEQIKKYQLTAKRNMNTNNELKPGDRVRLTGPSEIADDYAMQIFKNDGHRFPVCATAHIFHDGIFILIDNQVCENGSWSIRHFTYEKITEHGNG